ncbi:MAG: HAD-IIA family hydrolase [Anaerolineae bacterium]
MDLASIRAVTLDMDGVLWRDDTPMPGLREFFDFIRANNIAYTLATNNSYKTPAAYVAKLLNMGVMDVDEALVITSATATADYMRQHYPVATRVYVVGGNGLREALADAGMEVVDEGARVVVAGIDPQLTYDKLKHATLQIRAGADFIGTNPDKTFPTPEGLAPGAGSVLAAIAAATDRQPIVIGKPDTPMLETALRIMGTSADHTLMVGDRLDTDILGGQRTGMKTAFVLTGVSTRADIALTGIVPDGVYEHLLDLTRAWQA